jgi:adenosylhomocysteine nucleosidase
VPIAILAAMSEELQAVQAQLAVRHRELLAGREVLSGTLHGHPVVLALARIGKVAAATTATAVLQRFSPQVLLFTGVAGGLGAGVSVGDIVVGRQFLQHDLDASPIFPRHEVPLYGCSRFDADPQWQGRLLQASQQVAADAQGLVGAQALASLGVRAPRVHEGLIISGDRFVSSASEAGALQRELPEALAVEMEGAAVAQVCHDHGVPFAAVRVVSDRADDDAHVEFPRFVQQVASRYSAALVQAVLQKLPSIAIK